MDSFLTYNTNRIGLTLVLLMFCFLPRSACAGNAWWLRQAQPPAATFSKDSIKGKYALNDPRNPDCPCHKYQKLADEEYKNSQMQGFASQENGRQRTAQRSPRNFPADINSRPDEAKSRSVSSENHLHKKHNSALVKFKHHRKSKRFTKWKWFYGIKQWDIWKRIADPTACYRWN